MNKIAFIYINRSNVARNRQKLILIRNVSKDLVDFVFKCSIIYFIFILKSIGMTQNLHLDQFLVHYERKVKTKCQICASSFKLGTAQHLCKRCLRSVCADCSPFKVKCYMQNYKNNLHRQCRKCHIQSEILQKYIQVNKLKWGEDSDLVKLWMRNLGIKSAPRKRNSQKKKVKEWLTFMQIWKSLNFSFREFVGIVLDQTKVPETEVTELVNLALSQLSTNKLADLQHLVYIVIFFLTHCNLNNAIFFTTTILQIVYTEEPSMDNIHYFLQQMHCTQIEVYKMENIIEETFEKIVKRCTLNVFPTQISIQIISQILSKRDFEELEKGIAFVLSQRKEFICQNSNKPQDIFIDILRNANSSNYRKVVKQIDRENSGRSSPDARSLHSMGSHSEKSDQQSIKSTSSRQYHLKKENEYLKNKVRQQENELETLRRQVQAFRSPGKSAKDSQKKVPQMNLFMKNVNEISLGKEKIKQQYDQSTSEENDQANFSNVIYKKNEEIIKLKRELELAREALVQVSDPKLANNQKEAALQNERRALKEKEQQIQKLKQEAESLKNTNKRLFMKLNELTNMLMDKQEKNITEANKFFDELPKEFNKQFSKDKQNDCKVY